MFIILSAGNILLIEQKKPEMKFFYLRKDRPRYITILHKVGQQLDILHINAVVIVFPYNINRIKTI